MNDERKLTGFDQWLAERMKDRAFAVELDRAYQREVRANRERAAEEVR